MGPGAGDRRDKLYKSWGGGGLEQKLGSTNITALPRIGAARVAAISNITESHEPKTLPLVEEENVWMASTEG